MPRPWRADLLLALRAVFLLPWHWLWHGRRGLAAFQESYFSEGLFPTSLSDRERQREASRCIACGLCDLPAAAAGIALSPSLLPLAFSRSKTELHWARASLAVLRNAPGMLQAAEKVCPTGVPLARLAAWLTDRETDDLEERR